MLLERVRDVVARSAAEEAVLYQLAHFGGVPGGDQVDLGREAKLARGLSDSDMKK